MPQSKVFPLIIELYEMINILNVAADQCSACSTHLTEFPNFITENLIMDKKIMCSHYYNLKL